jgi:hypothetical protein|nr:MAG TPA: hypothetical protein [Caudoviricetes sp.]
MGYYIKVTKQVASRILSDGVKPTKTADGNCIVWQSELNGVEGVNLSERAATVGGVLLTAKQAKLEIAGVEHHSECYTPAAYGGEDKISDTGQETAEYTQTVKDPEVIGASSADEKEVKPSKK